MGRNNNEYLEHKDQNGKTRFTTKTAAKLIHTPPQLLPGWNGASLYSNNITLLWSATHRLLGSFWITRQPGQNNKEGIDPTNMEIDQIPQESLNGDNMNQEQLDLSDSPTASNHSPPNNNPPTSPILEEPSEATYESP